MASVNPRTKEILLKIVYYGPGLGGKTTTLQYIHRTVQPEHRGKMVSLATAVDRTLYFDFLPIRLPKIGDYILRLQMFTGVSADSAGKNLFPIPNKPCAFTNFNKPSTSIFMKAGILYFKII